MCSIMSIGSLVLPAMVLKHARLSDLGKGLPLWRGAFLPACLAFAVGLSARYCIYLVRVIAFPRLSPTQSIAMLIQLAPSSKHLAAGTACIVECTFMMQLWWH